ncbi:MAG TPA: GspE/PulE family protein [Nitrospira sp.]|jgi:type II secretory ATPase GspE/PulE/Tfp pilus assembly ATPase PilB-like protein|nr:GspE/PulE family protein [Nitrospira sp.]
MDGVHVSADEMNGAGSAEPAVQRRGAAAKLARPSIEQNVLDLLVCRGILGQADLDRAVEEARGGTTDIEALLLDRYHVPKSVLGEFLSEYYQCPYLPFDERTVIDAGLVRTLSHDYLKKNLWLPIARRGQLVDVLTHDPHNLERGWDVRRTFPGMTIRFSVGLRRDLEQFLGTLAAQEGGAAIGTLLTELRDDAPPDPVPETAADPIDENDSLIVRLTNHLITEADRLGASDLHVEPCIGKKEMNIRFRVDGTCFTFTKVPAAYRRGLVSRIKIMANLDIAERRKPQDGKIRFKLGNQRTIELRVATLPTAGGNEDAVLRLLTAKDPMPLEAMEFMPHTLQAIKTLAERPHGIFLCVGPTGSGKTTLLHAILKHINTEERKIWTAEDPIEITQEGLRQLQIHQKIGLDFATAMRAFLRADPDVIMIGEMRDKETADIAIEASLTGHLVFSTLHTNSAVETVVRLLDLGCDPFNFADAMLGVLATRLCKRICAECKDTYRPSREEYDEMVESAGGVPGTSVMPEYDALHLFHGRGCDQCHRSGFKGRVPIHELLVGTEEIKHLIQSRARTADMLAAAFRDGMQTLLRDGIRKAVEGLTTYRQVRAVAAK